MGILEEQRVFHLFVFVVFKLIFQVLAVNGAFSYRERRDMRQRDKGTKPKPTSGFLNSSLKSHVTNGRAYRYSMSSFRWKFIVHFFRMAKASKKAPYITYAKICPCPYSRVEQGCQATLQCEMLLNLQPLNLHLRGKFRQIKSESKGIVETEIKAMKILSTCPPIHFGYNPPSIQLATSNQW